MSSTPPPSHQGQAEAALIALYVAVEAALLAGAAKLLARLPVASAMPRLRRLTRQAVAHLTAETPALVQAVIDHENGQARARVGKQLERLHSPSQGPGDTGTPPPPPRPPGGLALPGDDGFFDLSMDHGDRAAQAIRDDLVSSLEDVRFRITRLPDDIYKAVAPQAAIVQVLDNNATLEQAQAAAWQTFTRSGVTGFTDKGGRNWALSSYVEMAVRTAAARAFNASSLARMQAVGFQYFTVPPHVHPCPQCGPWQGAILTSGPNPDPSIPTDGTIEEATAAGLFHPNCFPDFTRVASPTGVRAADARWYEGDLVVIHTASGDELSVTPNHPVLTPEGWVGAGALVVGDRVIRHRGNVERVDGVSPRDQQVEARISDVVDALRHSSGVTTARVPASPEQFHGDGGDSDVEVVLVHSLLSDRVETGGGEDADDRSLLVGGVRFSALLPSSAADEVLMGSLCATHRGVGSFGEGHPIADGSSGHAAAHHVTEVGPDASFKAPAANGRLTDSESLSHLSLSQAGHAEAQRLVNAGVSLSGPTALDVRSSLGAADSALAQPDLDPTPADTEGGRDLLRSLSGQVSTDDVIDVDRRHFAGHVYNLESGDGWYVAESIVVHNCRDVLTAWNPILPRPERREWTGEDDLRYRATQKQRALEVEIRKAKRAEQTALTPEAKAAARKDVRAAQARIRAHLAEHSTLGRQSRREQPNLRMGVQNLTPWQPPPGPKPPYSDGSAPDWTAAG